MKYDLQSDPGELTNLYMEPRHREVRARFQQRPDELMKAIRDPIVPESRQYGRQLLSWFLAGGL